MRGIKGSIATMTVLAMAGCQSPKDPQPGSALQAQTKVKSTEAIRAKLQEMSAVLEQYKMCLSSAQASCASLEEKLNAMTFPNLQN